MVMAHLKTRATRKDPEERLRRKLSLMKGLYKKGFKRQDVLELSRFIDWLLVLPDAFGQRFHNRLKEYEANMGTPYITRIERSGIAKGIEQGLARGMAAERALLRRQARSRFGETCAGRLEQLIEAVEYPDRLADIGEWIIDCESGDAFLLRVRKLTCRGAD